MTHRPDTWDRLVALGDRCAARADEFNVLGGADRFLYWNAGERVAYWERRANAFIDAAYASEDHLFGPVTGICRTF